MPEIGEVARVIHYLHKHVVGRTIARIIAPDDTKLFKDCTGEQFRQGLTGKKILDARQQGKYFWLVMSSPPHPLMHLGMTGWIRLSNEATAYYKPEREDPEWPPRFWKFQMEFEDTEDIKIAFVDSRRFGRVRLLNCQAAEIDKIEPLNKNGPDPIHQPELFTLDYFTQKVQAKRVPIKALLLDQANISGLGNWVCDELLYDARVHPEQYCNSLSDGQIKQLYTSIKHVCGIACDVLSDSSKFPPEWIMPYRWGKGKNGNILPNGERLSFITAAGRTSAIVLTRQKKSGRITEGVKVIDDESEAEVKPSPPARPAKRRGANYQKSKKREHSATEVQPKQEPEDHDAVEGADSAGEPPKAKKRKATKKPTEAKPAPLKSQEGSNISKKIQPSSAPSSSRRRSARLSTAQST